METRKAAMVEEVACFYSKDLTRIVKESSVLSGEVFWVEMIKVVDLVGAQSCLLLVQTIWGQVDVNLLACLLRWLGGTLLGRDLDQEATVAAGIVVNGFRKLLLQGEEPLLCRILICLDCRLKNEKILSGGNSGHSLGSPAVNLQVLVDGDLGTLA
eukprot:Cvel_27513.t1-p1 / transcript=Cvel_27513.t1 / gene=Cvel_27513 / organism=Chromera_velia_CCMP2878 / gene_product=hypothetical protein / transcript_product=hypothetical protein / location=Cvel_scaffold3447:1359-6534(-) / protein_length=155 / sequence_SO=supercontig / SO=protein_coding / is_pseudo=false